MQDAKRYARDKFRASLASGAFDLALLVAFLLSGASLGLARGLAAAGATAWGWNVAAYVIVVAIGFKIVTLPFDVWGRRIEIRYAMNRQGVGSWLADEGKGLLLGLILGVGAAEVIYLLLHLAPQHWWLWAWVAFVAFLVLMAMIAPVLLLPLFFKLRLMTRDDERDRALVERLEATHARLRAANPKLPRLHGIFEWKLGEKSAKANAALTGWGRTRRVIISDTLLEGSPVEEIEAVFLHELGHHVHRDIWRGLAFQAGLGLLGLGLAQWALAGLAPRLGLAGVADVAGLPLILLVFTVLGLVLMPASNGFVRAMERRADDYAFATLGTAEPLIAGLERLAAKNLAEVAPPRWKEWMLYSHPAIATRVRRGREWERRRLEATAQ